METEGTIPSTEPEQNPEQIIADILKRQRKVSITEALKIAGFELNVDHSAPKEVTEEEYAVVLEYGGKLLEVFVSRPNGKIDTFVSNIDEPEALPHQPNETTFLYTAAQKVMKELANADQKKYVYIFRTDYPQMLAWAETKGQDIFHWQEHRAEEMKGGTEHFLQTTIEPETYED
ncbi:MAG TPA: hypothetical protein VJB37_00805 [Patescibacteria group bacterium]|nr:hypothetical protein [Patescibacteria group bacterium]